VSYDDKTRDELRDELKRRDLPVSGSKSELVERLEEADQDDEEQDTDAEEPADDQDASDGDDGEDEAGEDDAAGEDAAGDGAAPSGRSGSGGSGGGLKPMQLVRLAGAQLMQLTGRDIDGTSGIEHTEEGWRVLFEVVEVTRVPRAMDVLGLYEVIVDEDGDLVRYERIRRFVRTQAEDGE
jgi:hypothetical protein